MKLAASIRWTSKTNLLLVATQFKMEKLADIKKMAATLVSL